MFEFPLPQELLCSHQTLFYLWNYYNTIVSNNIYQSILLSKQFIPLFVSLVFLNNSHIYILLLPYPTLVFLVVVVDSESNKFHNSKNDPFSVALFEVMYWYIIPVQHISLPLDGEHQILLFNWLEYIKQSIQPGSFLFHCPSY